MMRSRNFWTHAPARTILRQKELRYHIWLLADLRSLYTFRSLCCASRCRFFVSRSYRQSRHGQVLGKPRRTHFAALCGLKGARARSMASDQEETNRGVTFGAGACVYIIYIDKCVYIYIYYSTLDTYVYICVCVRVCACVTRFVRVCLCAQ